MHLRLAAIKQLCADNFCGNVRQPYRILAPIENMHINSVVLPRACEGRRRFPRPAAGAVNAFAILCEPRADFLEPRGLLWVNDSIRSRADVQQYVPDRKSTRLNSSP